LGPVVAYFNFCERELGPDGQLLAGVMLQGFENESAESGRALGELAAAAAARPAVAEALRAGRFSDLASLHGGPEFVDQLQKFLDDFGWRAESWSLTHLPVWAEDPAAALGYVARYLDESAGSPRAAIDRAVEGREQARAEAFSRLSEEKQRELRDLLSAAEHVTRLSEARAFWQLTAAGVLRVPILALGNKLVEAGVLQEAADVFHLYLEEAKDVAREPRVMSEPVAERKNDMARWENLNPPQFVGAPGPPPSPPDPVMQAGFRLVLGVGAPSSVDGAVISGTAASRGVARGPARLLRSLADGDRLQQGDIMVCATTSPSWTPLFAVAGGVVTDSGGILTHSAICAREFGIPCVVGTQVATSLIADGAMVVVDGTAGTVTIEI
jgi:pyruvate,water dikinase